MNAKDLVKEINEEKFRYDLTAYELSSNRIRVLAPHMSLVLDILIKETTLFVEVKQITLQNADAEMMEQSAIGDFFTDYRPNYYDSFSLLVEVALMEGAYKECMTVEIDQELDTKEEEIPLAEHLKDKIMLELDSITLQLKTADLTSRVPGLIIERAGGVVPFQSEGTILGYQYYFRYRGGNASLRVGGEDPVGEPLWSAYMTYGDDLGGSLSMKEFTYLFCALLTHLKKAPYSYRFTIPEENLAQILPGHSIVDAVLKETLERYLPIYSYGFSEQEAREKLREQEEQFLKAREEVKESRNFDFFSDRPYFDPDLLVIESEDPRKFPEQEPDFKVLNMPEPTAACEVDEEGY